MTNRVTLAGSEVSVVDGLIFLVTGDKKGLHGEFWLEPDEQVVVIRYPKSDA